MTENRYKKGYYIVCIVFILRILSMFLYLDGEGQVLIDFGFYNTHVSDLGLSLCKCFIYTIAMYGLINNFSWGLISTTLISFCISIVSLRDLIQYSDMIQYGDYTFVINTILFLSVFAYLSSVISKKIKEIVED